MSKQQEQENCKDPEGTVNPEDETLKGDSRCGSRTIWLSAGAVLVIVVISVALIVSFTITGRKPNDIDYGSDDAPHEWRIDREMWGATPYNHTATTHKFDPLKLVVIHHTASEWCPTFERCFREIRLLQRYFLMFEGHDLPYNFMIGNDGRVYEARSWGFEGAQRIDVNRCSVTIGFVGDYREELEGHTRVTEAQLNRTKMILNEGVELGYLVPDFLVVGARDLVSTHSPGSNLYHAIQQWDNYDHENRYRGLACEQIYGLEEVITAAPDDWFISREMWGSVEVNNTYTTEEFDPLTLVVIQHTVTTECSNFLSCSTAMRTLQQRAMNSLQIDLPYNFVVANDGRVYEGRGWGVEGAQRFEFNRCTLNIGFIGDYRGEIEGHSQVTEAQLHRTRLLLDEGVQFGHLLPEYTVVGAGDISDTQSPGSNLLDAIQKWDNYDHDNRYGMGITCDEIYET